MFAGTIALCSWSFCIACAVFWKCQPSASSRDASTVNQVALVLRPLSSGKVRSPTGVGTRMIDALVAEERAIVAEAA